ncbi:MAG: hypothetical protein J6A89_01345 [Clostridia bacterium]|nr:hypothetical protein [Clostridia bacterium]
MENSNEKDIIIRIEKKIDDIINYTIKIENNESNSNSNLDKKSRQQNENRKIINKILYTLPQLEKFSELKEFSKKEIEYLTDDYIESLMGTKNVNNLAEYSLFRSDVREKIRTKIFVNRIQDILDSYLNMKTDIKLDTSKKTENYNIESLNIKKAILRRVYGYKLQEGEKKAKSREEFAEIIGYTPRSVYMYQNELLDDLAPSFFGIDGLIL